MSKVRIISRRSCLFQPKQYHSITVDFGLEVEIEEGEDVKSALSRAKRDAEVVIREVEGIFDDAVNSAVDDGFKWKGSAFEPPRRRRRSS